jgi:hypothetical protein
MLQPSKSVPQQRLLPLFIEHSRSLTDVVGTSFVDGHGFLSRFGSDFSSPSGKGILSRETLRFWRKSSPTPTF